MNIAVFRKDKKNVGDWHSVPANFLPLRGTRRFDLAEPETIPNEPGTVILGGGGLGRPDFEPFLRKLLREDRRYRIIAWGVGADSVTRKGDILDGPEDMGRLLRYFDGVDEIGSRIVVPDTISPPENYHWVPCASCLSRDLEPLRDTPIVRQIGVYEHLRVSVSQHLPSKSKVANQLLKGIRFGSNRGTDLSAKLKFMAESEYVFTNSYHGVYWGTLLNRKVVCFPFKNGLFTFRHPPSYVGQDGIEAAMERARTYPDALDECRMANLNFYAEMLNKYGDI